MQPLDLGAGPSVLTASQEFDDFARHQSKRVDALARRYGLERREVLSQTCLAFLEAKQRYSANHASGASLSTYVFRSVEYALKHMVSHTLRSVEYTSELELDAVDQVTDLADETELQGVREGITGLDVALDDVLSRAYSDLVFEDAIRSHPVYTSEQFRVVIDGVIAHQPKEDIAAALGVSVRRVYQLVSDIEATIRRGDPLRDDALLNVEGDLSMAADPVRYRRLASLSFRPESALDSPLLQLTAVSIIKHGVVRPVVVDQFMRVLVGDYECVAASRLGLRFIRTIVHALDNGSQSRSTEVFERVHGELDTSSPAAPYRLPLNPSLAKHIARGSLSTLVAARIVYLPVKAQFHLAGELGVLIPFLSASDANKLVRAHDDGCLVDTLRTMRDQIIGKLTKAFASPGDENG